MLHVVRYVSFSTKQPKKTKTNSFRNAIFREYIFGFFFFWEIEDEMLELLICLIAFRNCGALQHFNSTKKCQIFSFSNKTKKRIKKYTINITDKQTISPESFMQETKKKTKNKLIYRNHRNVIEKHFFKVL